jgi:hypothetical protein
MTYYELVNLSSGNRIGEFDTEEEALSNVRTYCMRLGEKALGAIALTETDDAGRGSILAEGEDLAHRARARVPA